MKPQKTKDRKDLKAAAEKGRDELCSNISAAFFLKLQQKPEGADAWR